MDKPEDLVTVTIEPAHTKILSPRASVLDVVRRAGGYVPSACGSHGTCGKCRTLLSPSPLPRPADLKHLSPAEIAAGIRLACQHTVESGIEITTVIPVGRVKHVAAPDAIGSFRPDTMEAGTFGVAIDIGTTTLACYLIDLFSGVQVQEMALLNPQSQYGADVISRIEYAGRVDGGAQVLKDVLLDSLQEMVRDLCRSAAISEGQVERLSFVGNTTMQHLLLGLDVRPLGLAPYTPSSYKSFEAEGTKIGMKVVPKGNVYVAPVVSGFVGGDTVAFVLNQNLDRYSGTALGIDIGTNGEIVLTNGSSTWCCSTAAGPAFEGATISQGMRAETGAIEYVTISDRDSVPEITTIDDSAPYGLCGSGILDLVAEMYRTGILDSSGRYTGSTRLSGSGTGTKSYSVVEGGVNGRVLFTQRDVRQVQLAKAAIAAGTAVLMKEAGLRCKDLQAVYLAGAFGSYLNPESAIRIGLLPPVDISKVIGVGNAAGAGAKMLLLSKDERWRAAEVARSLKYIELASHGAFSDLFVSATDFDSSRLWDTNLS